MQALVEQQAHFPQSESNAHFISLFFCHWLEESLPSRKFTVFLFGHHYIFMSYLALRAYLVF